MRTWLREPLLHFLVLGALLFAANAWFGDSPAANARIVVSDDQIARLADLFAAQWRRPPTDAELDRLIEQFVREEVLYREGVALGLDQNDTIVRRRVVQKLEFLSQDLVDDDPSEAELRQFYEDHPERFVEPASVSFHHVFFNPDARGDGIEADALTALAALHEGADPADLGDTFLLPLHFEERSVSELAGLFGADFAEQLASVDLGAWLGPIASGYGLHLVRIDARVDAHAVPFDDARDDVRTEYLAAQRRDADAALYARLRARYDVEIER